MTDQKPHLEEVRRLQADDYIRFEDCAVPDVRKTRIVNVVSISQNKDLGQIKWYGPWRQYCFFPSPLRHLVFNSDCMERITLELSAMTTAHRTSRRV